MGKRIILITLFIIIGGFALKPFINQFVPPNRSNAYVVKTQYYVDGKATVTEKHEEGKEYVSDKLLACFPPSRELGGPGAFMPIFNEKLNLCITAALSCEEIENDGLFRDYDRGGNLFFERECAEGEPVRIQINGQSLKYYPPGSAGFHSWSFPSIIIKYNKDVWNISYPETQRESEMHFEQGELVKMTAFTPEQTSGSDNETVIPRKYEERFFYQGVEIRHYKF